MKGKICILSFVLLNGCLMRPDIPTKSSTIPPKKITPALIDAYAISGDGIWKLMLFDLEYQNTKGDSVAVLGLAFRKSFGSKAQILLAVPMYNGREYAVQQFIYDNGLAVQAGGLQVDPLLTVRVDDLISELLKVNGN